MCTVHRFISKDHSLIVMSETDHYYLLSLSSFYGKDIAGMAREKLKKKTYISWCIFEEFCVGGCAKQKAMN